MVHRLHRGMAHLLALPAARRRLRLRLLAIMLLETNIHIALNIGDVCQNISDHAHLNRPSEEIELADGCLLYRCLAANLETDALPSAEGIKEPLRIRLEFALVVEMDHKLTYRIRGIRIIGQRITNIELLGIVGDEPVYETQTHRRCTCQNRQNLGQSSRLIVELLEPADNEILFALDAVLQCLAQRIHLCFASLFGC